MNAKVLETLKKSAAVPSMPQVVLRFLEIMQDPEFEYGDLVKILSADPGTASEILRLANSALFGVRNKVVSIRQALTLLGPKRTRSLLLGRYLVDVMSEKQVVGLDMNYYWRRSLASSVVAAHFADTVVPQRRDEAFIGALLADIGICILAEAFPQRYRPIVDRFAPYRPPASVDEEIDAVEVSHAQVSAMVLAHWTLPDSVCHAVNMHQSENPAEGEVGTVARLLHAADQVSRVLCETPRDDGPAAACLEAMSFAGLEIQVLGRMLPTIESEIEELADALRIDVVAGDVYAQVAKALQEKIASPVGR